MAGYKGYEGGKEVDWSQVRTDAPVPLEPGIYLATVTQAEIDKSQKGDPMIKVQLEVEEMFDGDADVEGRALYDNMTLKDKALFKIKQFHEASNIELPPTTRFEDVEVFAEDMVGIKVYCEVSVRTWDGKPRNQLDFYIHPDNIDEYVESKKGSAPKGSGGRKREIEGRGERGGGRRRDKDDSDKEDRRSRRSRRSRDDGDDGDGDGGDDKKADKEDKGSSRRRSRTQASNGRSSRDVEDIDDKDDDDDKAPDSEQPRRARRRQRPQAEQE